MNKQIEEMFNDIVEISDKEYYYDNKGHCRMDFVDLDNLAEKLSEKYQPKIPEGAVVLTREEIEIQCENYLNGIKYWQDMANKERKETAEKFAKKLKELVAYRNCNEYYYWEDVQVDGQIFVECVNEVKKEVAEWNNG